MQYAAVCGHVFRMRRADGRNHFLATSHISLVNDLFRGFGEFQSLCVKV